MNRGSSWFPIFMEAGLFFSEYRKSFINSLYLTKNKTPYPGRIRGVSRSVKGVKFYNSGAWINRCEEGWGAYGLV